MKAEIASLWDEYKFYFIATAIVLVVACTFIFWTMLPIILIIFTGTWWWLLLYVAIIPGFLTIASTMEDRGWL